MNVLRDFLLWCSTNRWMNTRLPRYRFVQRAVKRFMPGTTPEAALAEARKLGQKGIKSVLTCLGENVRNRAQAEEVCRHYLGVLDRIAERKLDSHISVKLTHLGLDLDARTPGDLLSRLAQKAAERRNFVWVDMEASAYVQRTLDIFREAQRTHGNIGICLQAYLYRTPTDVDSLRPLAPHIRLVKGAYREPRSIAYARKRDVDHAYLKLAARLMGVSRNGGGTLAIATHDMRILAELRSQAGKLGLDKREYEFQLLYGIKREAQRHLAAEGEPVRVLISYGESWFPWYMRRLAERPGNVLFVLRSLFG